MSWRAIQDTVGVSRSLSDLSAGAERLYWRMLAYTDPWGRLEGDPVKVKALVMPLVDAAPHAVVAWLGELGAAGRVVVYEADGRTVAQVVDFEANQPPEFIRRRGPSKYPDLQEAPNKSRSVPEAPNKSRLEEKRREEKNSPPIVPPSRKRDELWDALASELRGQPKTDSERGRWNKALKEIRDAGGTPDELGRAAREFRQRWPNATLTATALSANWGSLLSSPNGAPLEFVCPECTAGFKSERALLAHRSTVHDVVAA